MVEKVSERAPAKGLGDPKNVARQACASRLENPVIVSAQTHAKRLWFAWWCSTAFCGE
jgi:hypothetical protein